MAAKIIKISCDQSCSMQKQFLRRPLENGESLAQCQARLKKKKEKK